MKSSSFILATLVALPMLVEAAPKARPAANPQSKRVLRNAPSYLEGINPMVGFNFQGISLKKRNNELKQRHSNLQSTDLKGVTLGLGVEHRLDDMPEINFATRAYYQFGRDAQEAKVANIDHDTYTNQHAIRLAEALQFGIGTKSGTLRPTAEFGAGYLWIHDELNTSGNNGSIEANGSNFFFDLGGGLDFKFNNGITPFAMAYYRFATVPKKDVKVTGTGPFEAAEAIEYQLSGAGFNVGLGHTF